MKCEDCENWKPKKEKKKTEFVDLEGLNWIDEEEQPDEVGILKDERKIREINFCGENNYYKYFIRNYNESGPTIWRVKK